MIEESRYKGFNKISNSTEKEYLTAETITNDQLASFITQILKSKEDLAKKEKTKLIKEYNK